MIRRTIQFSMVLALLGAGVALAQTAPPGDDDDDVAGAGAAANDDDELDGRDRANQRRLKNVVRAVDHEDERLAKVLGIIGPPDQPIPDETRTALVGVRTAAQEIVGRAAPYLAAQPPGPTAPPGATAAPAPPDAPATTAAPARPRDIRRLRSIARNLAQIDERLSRVLGIIGPPDQPIPDEVRAEIGNVRTAAQTVIGRVDPYLGTVVPPPPPDGGGGGTVPPPPTDG